MTENFSVNTFMVLLLGLIFLVKGGLFLIKGSEKIVHWFNLSHHFVGLTVIAIGTSLPEFNVYANTALTENYQANMTTVLSSNIVLILLIIGICAMLQAIPVRKDIMKFEIPYIVFAVLVVYLFAVLNIVGDKKYVINMTEGIILLILFFLFIFIHFNRTKQDRVVVKSTSIWRKLLAIFLVLLGIAEMFVGGKLIVTAIVGIAEQSSGRNHNVMHVLVSSLGTSLPEITTSIILIIRRNYKFLWGNIVGSSVFNLLGIVGLTTFWEPVKVTSKNFTDMGIATIAGLLLIIFVMTNNYRVLRFSAGLTLMLCFVIYVILLLDRENILFSL